MNEEQSPFRRSLLMEQVVNLFARLAQDVEKAGPLTEKQIRQRIRALCERALDMLEDEGEDQESDVFADLEKQSRDIAAELRRVEGLMKRKPSE